jgi:hypothetical protein
MAVLVVQESAEESNVVDDARFSWASQYLKEC